MINYNQRPVSYMISTFTSIEKEKDATKWTNRGIDVSIKWTIMKNEGQPLNFFGSGILKNELAQ